MRRPRQAKTKKAPGHFSGVDGKSAIRHPPRRRAARAGTNSGAWGLIKRIAHLSCVLTAHVEVANAFDGFDLLSGVKKEHRVGERGSRSESSNDGWVKKIGRQIGKQTDIITHRRSQNGCCIEGNLWGLSADLLPVNGHTTRRHKEGKNRCLGQDRLVLNRNNAIGNKQNTTRAKLVFVKHRDTRG